MDKIAIYTCIIGGYDKLRQPLETQPGFDFICFVGKGESHPETDGVWQVRELPLTFKDPSLDARYPKTHPHELLPEYECSVWIDGNIIIRDSTLYKAARIKQSAGVLFSGVTHPSRNCVYEEAVKCRDMGYISYLKLFRIFLFYRRHHIARHDGLYEANLIFRRHNHPDIVRFDEMWWDKVRHFCRRDQLSQMYCLRKCDIPKDFLLPQGQSTRNNPGFEYLRHGE